MSNPNRTADNAYYASRQELNIRGTREGSKTSKSIATYQHVTNLDASTSADKYYASAQAASNSVVVPQAKPAKRVELTYGQKSIVEAVIEELAAGATTIVVNGSAEEIRQAQISVDLAVGRNTLTRAQADNVSYQVLAAAVQPAVETEPAPEPVVEPVAEQIVAPVPEELEDDADITVDDVAAVFGVDADDSDA
jgi:hypothetical protein